MHLFVTSCLLLLTYLSMSEAVQTRTVSINAPTSGAHLYPGNALANTHFHNAAAAAAYGGQYGAGLHNFGAYPGFAGNPGYLAGVPGYGHNAYGAYNPYGTQFYGHHGAAAGLGFNAFGTTRVPGSYTVKTKSTYTTNVPGYPSNLGGYGASSIHVGAYPGAVHGAVHHGAVHHTAVHGAVPGFPHYGHQTHQRVHYNQHGIHRGISQISYSHGGTRLHGYGK